MQSSEIDSVNSDENLPLSSDKHADDLIAEYEENGVMRPDERLSEAFPEQFDIYCEHFVDFFPLSLIHI